MTGRRGREHGKGISLSPKPNSIPATDLEGAAAERRAAVRQLICEQDATIAITMCLQLEHKIVN